MIGFNLWRARGLTTPRLHFLMTDIGDYGLTREDFERILTDAEIGAVEAAEMDFVAEIKERFGEYAMCTFLTERQLRWLKQIGGRHE